MEQDKKATSAVKEYYAALRLKDVEEWVALFADDAVTYCPVGEPPNEGHEGLRRFFNTVVPNFKKLEIRPSSIYAIPREAGVMWSCRAETLDGTTLEMEGIDVFRFSEAYKITEVRAYWDPQAFFSALDGAN